MKHTVAFWLIVCVVLCFSAGALSQPQSVPRLTERALDQASYAALAREWKEYMEKNGETAEGLCNLGMAYCYMGELEAARETAKRAVELEPTSARALALHAKVLTKIGEHLDDAIVLLERCREVAPDYEEGLTTLAVIRLRRGELDEAERIFKTIFEQRVLARPLQDYAYNMLVGLPRDAVLITNGDNDTFPALALQAGMNFRTDVTVINRYLLGLQAFSDALFERHPSLRPEGVVGEEQSGSRAAALLTMIVDEQKAPVHIAVSVPIEQLALVCESVTEGVTMRLRKDGLGAEEAALLVLERYRLDSATDWTIGWDLVPSMTNMVGNYVRSMIRMAQREGVRADTRRRLLEKAKDLATFHEMSWELSYLRSMQEQ